MALRPSPHCAITPLSAAVFEIIFANGWIFEEFFPGAEEALTICLVSESIFATTWRFREEALATYYWRLVTEFELWLDYSLDFWSDYDSGSEDPDGEGYRAVS